MVCRPCIENNLVIHLALREKERQRHKYALYHTVGVIGLI